MDEILTKLSTSISEFKNNPQAAVRRAGDEPFAVLTNNKPTFYVISPSRFDALLELQWERSIAPTVKKRLQKRDQAVRVELEDL